MSSGSKLGSSRGFTLVELMIVVGVVGILSVLAIFSYRKWIRAARLTEATHMVAAIREGQERYKAEVGTYADVSASITSTYPSATPDDRKSGWGGACVTCFNKGMSFASISVQTSDPVQFGYATVAGDSGTTAASKIGALTLNGKSLDLSVMDGKLWYVAYARDDADKDSKYTQVVGTSATNDVFIDETSP